MKLNKTANKYVIKTRIPLKLLVIPMPHKIVNETSLTDNSLWSFTESCQW